MIYGSLWASGWGDPANAFVHSYPDLLTAAKVGYLYIPWHFQLRSTFGNSYIAVWVNGKRYATPYIPEGQDVIVNVQVPAGTSVSVWAIRLNQLNDSSWDNPLIPLLLEQAVVQQVVLTWTFQPTVIQTALQGGTYCSSWVLNGLVQGSNCAVVSAHPYWGKLTFTISVVAGVATIQMFNNSTLVLQGVGNVGTTISLVGQNRSGLSGSVALAGGAVNVNDGVLCVRWPSSFAVFRGTTSPPAAQIATVPFDPNNNPVRWPDPQLLTGGNTYYYRGQEISDTGEAGSFTSIKSFPIPAPPAPPTALSYVSGNAGGTTISFQNSATAGAAYKVYAPTAIGGVPNLNAPVATVAAGTPSAVQTVALPAVTGYPGLLPVIVRASVGGVEESNVNTLVLEYDASGNYVPARPNAPGILSWTMTAGKTVTAQVVYSPANQIVAPTLFRLYLRTPTGSYISAAASAAPTTLGNGMLTAQIVYAIPSDGFYYMVARAVSAAGIENSSLLDVETLVEADDTVLAAPSDFDGELGRA